MEAFFAVFNTKVCLMLDGEVCGINEVDNPIHLILFVSEQIKCMCHDPLEHMTFGVFFIVHFQVGYSENTQIYTITNAIESLIIIVCLPSSTVNV